MSRSIYTAVFILLVASVMFAPAARAATPQQVDEAIKKAKAFLRSQQGKDGSWDPAMPGADHMTGGQWGGQTAIATYALLAGGDSPQEPHIKKAVHWLGN